ncbi:MAG: hypothetical protein WC599_08575, partial [Bacteroidales bacterium]
MKRLFIIVSLFFLATSAYATHMRAGEITYKWINTSSDPNNPTYLTYEITIVTYTYTPSLADRPEYDISWGDGTTSTIYRNEKINLPDSISRNTYIGQHTFPGPYTYIISLEDPNRNGGVFNIPNSINVPFYIQ